MDLRGHLAALGARCRRFESCLPDAIKSQSPADISTAPQGAVFYCLNTRAWSRCGERAEPRSAHHTNFLPPVDTCTRYVKGGLDPPSQPRRAPGASPAQRFTWKIPLNTPITTSRKQAPPDFLDTRLALLDEIIEASIRCNQHSNTVGALKLQAQLTRLLEGS